MKKIITIIVAILMIASVLTGCGTSAEKVKDIGLNVPKKGTFKTDDSTKAAVSKSVTDKAVDTTTEEPVVTAELDSTEAAVEANADTSTDTNVSANTEATQSAPATQSDNKPAATKAPEGNANSNAKQPSVQAQNNTPAQPAQPVKTPAPAATPAPHQHSYSGTITANATCNNAGVKTYSCACGSTYTESIPATGQHNWVNHTVTKTVAKSVDLSNELHTLSYHNGCDVEVTKLAYCACGKYFLGDAAMLHRAIAYDEDPTSRHNQRSCDHNDNPSGYWYIEGAISTETVVDYVYCSVCGTHK